MAFLRIVLIFFLIFLAVRLLGRILFPDPSKKKSTGPSEGDVTVENKDKDGKRIKKDEGEYIDYEEIDD